MINEKVTGTEFQDELRGNLPPRIVISNDVASVGTPAPRDTDEVLQVFEGTSIGSVGEEKPGTIGFFFADEFSACQAPTKKKKLAKRGKTPVVKSSGGRKRQNVIGLLSVFAATVLSMFVEKNEREQVYRFSESNITILWPP